jgi:hypothetical protein
MTANDFIESQLTDQLISIEEMFRADALGISGPLTIGVDNLLRDAIESRPVKSPRLAVLLTTDGGYVEVVKRMVETIRHHYSEVDMIIPDHAFSAGTIFAMSADEIYMDYYSRLGPIDPQVQSATGQMVPALGYLIQWERLLTKAAKGTITLPEVQLMVSGFDQAELYAYEQARELSVALLKEWLVRYKFRNWQTTETRREEVTPAMRERRAEEIARALNDPDKWHSHGHGIRADTLNDLGLKTADLETDHEKHRTVTQYHRLLEDYMAKLGHTGAIHSRKGGFMPYA